MNMSTARQIEKLALCPWDLTSVLQDRGCQKRNMDNAGLSLYLSHRRQLMLPTIHPCSR